MAETPQQRRQRLQGELATINMQLTTSLDNLFGAPSPRTKQLQARKQQIESALGQMTPQQASTPTQPTQRPTPAQGRTPRTQQAPRDGATGETHAQRRRRLEREANALRQQIAMKEGGAGNVTTQFGGTISGSSSLQADQQRLAVVEKALREYGQGVNHQTFAQGAAPAQQFPTDLTPSRTPTEGNVQPPMVRPTVTPFDTGAGDATNQPPRPRPFSFQSTPTSAAQSGAPGDMNVAQARQAQAMQEIRARRQPGTTGHAYMIAERLAQQLGDTEEDRAQAQRFLKSLIYMNQTVDGRPISPTASAEEVRRATISEQRLAELMGKLATPQGQEELSTQLQRFQDERIMASRRANPLNLDSMGNKSLTANESVEFRAAKAHADAMNMNVDDYIRQSTSSELKNIRDFYKRLENVTKQHVNGADFNMAQATANEMGLALGLDRNRIMGLVEGTADFLSRMPGVQLGTRILEKLSSDEFAGPASQVLDTIAGPGGRVASHILMDNPQIGRGVQQAIEGAYDGIGNLVGQPIGVAEAAGLLPRGSMLQAQRAVSQFLASGYRGFTGAISSTVAIPAILGSEEFTRMADAMDSFTNQNGNLDDTFANDIGSGLGSMLAYMIPGLGAGRLVGGASALGRWTAAASMALMEAGGNVSGEFRDAERSILARFGNDAEGRKLIEDARFRAFQTMLADSAISSILNKFGILGEKGSQFRRYFFASFFEGLQEGMQETGGQYVGTGVIDPTTGRVKKAAFLGALLGLSGQLTSQISDAGDLVDAVDAADQELLALMPPPRALPAPAALNPDEVLPPGSTGVPPQSPPQAPPQALPAPTAQQQSSEGADDATAQALKDLDTQRQGATRQTRDRLAAVLESGVTENGDPLPDYLREAAEREVARLDGILGQSAATEGTASAQIESAGSPAAASTHEPEGIDPRYLPKEASVTNEDEFIGFAEGIKASSIKGSSGDGWSDEHVQFTLNGEPFYAVFDQGRTEWGSFGKGYSREANWKVYQGRFPQGRAHDPYKTISLATLKEYWKSGATPPAVTVFDSASQPAKPEGIDYGPADYTQTREEAVWGKGYSAQGQSTDRAIRGRIAKWQKIIDEATTSGVEPPAVAVEQLQVEKDRLQRAQAHEASVRQALRDGVAVSDDVLAQYPGIAEDVRAESVRGSEPKAKPEPTYNKEAIDQAWKDLTPEGRKQWVKAAGLDESAAKRTPRFFGAKMYEALGSVSAPGGDGMSSEVASDPNDVALDPEEPVLASPDDKRRGGTAQGNDVYEAKDGTLYSVPRGAKPVGTNREGDVVAEWPDGLRLAVRAGRVLSEEIDATERRDPTFLTAEELAEIEDQEMGEPDATAFEDWAPVVSPNLNESELAIEAATQARARAEYDALKERYIKENGDFDADGNLVSIVMNTDHWRHFFEEYNGYNAAAVHEASAWLNSRLLSEMMVRLQGVGNNTVVFLAGGGGPGKGTVVKQFFNEQQYPIRVDGTFSNLDSQRFKIEQAQNMGFDVEVVLVATPPVTAGRNSLERTIRLLKQGQLPRVVPTVRLIADNLRARASVLALMRTNLIDPAKVHIIQNNQPDEPTRVATGLISEEKVTAQIEFLENLTYNESEAVSEVAKLVEDALRAGQINEEGAAATLAGVENDSRTGKGSGRADGPTGSRNDGGQVPADGGQRGDADGRAAPGIRPGQGQDTGPRSESRPGQVTSTQDSQAATSSLADLIASMTQRVDTRMSEIEEGRKRNAKDMRDKRRGAFSLEPEDFEYVALTVFRYGLGVAATGIQSAEALYTAMMQRFEEVVYDERLRGEEVDEARRVMEDFLQAPDAQALFAAIDAQNAPPEATNNEPDTQTEQAPTEPEGVQDPASVDAGAPDGGAADEGGGQEPGVDTPATDQGVRSGAPRSPQDRLRDKRRRKSGFARGDRANGGTDGGSRNVREDGTLRPAGGDFFVPDDGATARLAKTLAAPAGVGGKVKRLVDAVAALRRIEKTGEVTREDQEALSLFPGWGFNKSVINPNRPDGQTRLARQLYQLMTSNERRDALRAGKNSHYTDPNVVNVIWKALGNMGVEGNLNVLEPSVGSGIFPMLMPKSMQEGSQWSMIDLDKTTATVAGYLFPNQTVINAGFQSARVPYSAFDLAITNVPFLDEANTLIVDPGFIKEVGNVNMAKQIMRRLHNYFIVKSLLATKPGGLVAVITTAGTMDSSDGAAMATREFLNANADLVAAVRLPSNAFLSQANTEVVTDLLIFRRNDGKQIGVNQFVDVQAVSLTNSEDKKVKLARNGFYTRRKGAVIGVETATGTMYRANQYNVVAEPGANVPALLAKALKRQIDSYTEQFEATHKGGKVFDPKGQSAPVMQPYVPQAGRMLGEIILEGDKIVEIASDGTYEVTFGADKASQAKKELWMSYGKLKNAVADIHAAQSEPDDVLAKAQQDLKKVYDEFVAKHGPLYSSTSVETKQLDENGQPEIDEDGNEIVETEYRLTHLPVLDVDPAWPRIFALEVFNTESGKVTGLADIFTKRTVKTERSLDDIETATDAIAASMNERGRLDMDFVEEITGMTTEEVLEEMGDQLFQHVSGEYFVRGDYMSGPVRVRHQEIMRAIERGEAKKEDYEEHLKALEIAFPNPVPYDKVRFSIRSHWMPLAVIQRFAARHLGATNAAEAIDKVENRQVYSVSGLDVPAATHQSYPSVKTVGQTLKAALDNTYLEVKTEDADGRKVQDHEATKQANDAKAKMAADFMQFVDSDAASRAAIEKAYNDVVNINAVTRYDGAKLDFPGLDTSVVQLRGRRVDAVWRGMQQRFTMLAHGVGSGKTYTGAMLALKLKQTGLANKPMFVAYKPTLEQVAADFQRAYPDANILAASQDSFSPGKRERFLAQIATGDWDLVVITKEHLDMMTLDADGINSYYDTMIQEFMEESGIEVSEIEDAVRVKQDKKSTRGIDPTTKEIANGVIALENQRQAALAKAAKNTTGLYFNTIGVDHLIIDEAHMYKGLAISSANYQTMIGGSASKLASELKSKFDYLRTIGGGGTMMTGTMLVNSGAEVYTWLRYLAPDELRAMGITSFDSFVDLFVDTEPQSEFRVDGTIKEIARIRAWVNMEELAALTSRFVDLMRTEDMPEIAKDLPDLEDEQGNVTKAPITVVVPATALQKNIINTVYERYREIAMIKPETREEMMELNSERLRLMDVAKKASQDARLVDAAVSAEEGGMKIYMAAKKAAEVYREFDADKATQIIFVDQGTPGGANDFNAYAETKRLLLTMGIPEKEIAMISDAGNNVDKRLAIAEGMRNGTIRILIGSRPKLGVGMNMQHKMKAVHHVNLGWNPAMLEQGNGRLIRWLNKFRKVRVYYYVTQGTSDQVQAGRTIDKHRAFVAFMRNLVGAAQGRKDVEDFSSEDGAMAIGEMFAASASDPRILELVSADQRLEQSRRMHAAEVRSKNIAQDELNRINERLRKAEHEMKVAVAEYRRGLDAFGIDEDPMTESKDVDGDTVRRPNRKAADMDVNSNYLTAPKGAAALWVDPRVVEDFAQYAKENYTPEELKRTPVTPLNAYEWAYSQMKTYGLGKYDRQPWAKVVRITKAGTSKAEPEFEVMWSMRWAHMTGRPPFIDIAATGEEMQLDREDPMFRKPLWPLYARLSQAANRTSAIERDIPQFQREVDRPYVYDKDFYASHAEVTRLEFATGINATQINSGELSVVDYEQSRTVTMPEGLTYTDSVAGLKWDILQMNSNGDFLISTEQQNGQVGYVTIEHPGYTLDMLVTGVNSGPVISHAADINFLAQAIVDRDVPTALDLRGPAATEAEQAMRDHIAEHFSTWFAINKIVRQAMPGIEVPTRVSSDRTPEQKQQIADYQAFLRTTKIGPEYSLQQGKKAPRRRKDPITGEVTTLPPLDPLYSTDEILSMQGERVRRESYPLIVMNENLKQVILGEVSYDDGGATQSGSGGTPPTPPPVAPPAQPSDEGNDMDAIPAGVGGFSQSANVKVGASRPVKKLYDVILDFEKAFPRVKGGAAPKKTEGAYIKKADFRFRRGTQNIRTTLHEAFHQMDTLYRVTENLGNFRTEIERELQDPAFQQTVGKLQGVARTREQAAEWFVMYMINPGKAAAIAPYFVRHLDNKVPLRTRGILGEFSQDLQAIFNSDPIQFVNAGMRDLDVTTSLKGKLMQMLGRIGKNPTYADDFDEFKSSPVAMIKVMVSNTLAPFEKATQELWYRTGIASPTTLRDRFKITEEGLVGADSPVQPDGLDPFKNPLYWMTRLPYLDQTMEMMISGGLVNIYGRKSDLHFNDIYEPISNLDGGFDKHYEPLRAFMAAQRHMELVDRDTVAKMQDLYDKERELEDWVARKMNARAADYDKAIADETNAAVIRRLQRRRDDHLTHYQWVLEMQADQQMTAYREKVEREFAYNEQHWGAIQTAGIVDATTTAKDVLDMIAKDPVAQRAYEQSAAAYRAIGDHVLQMLVDSGRMSADGAARIKEENQFWVSLKRHMGDSMSEFIGINAPAKQKTQSAEKRIKGSERPANDFMHNLFENVFDALVVAHQNKALLEWIELVEKAEGSGDIAVMIERGADSNGKNAFKVTGSFPENQVVKVYRNGRAERWFIPDQWVADSVTTQVRTFSQVDLQFLTKLFTGFANLTRTGVLYTPQYVIQNMFRDNWTRMLVARHGWKPWDIFARDKDADAQYDIYGVGLSQGEIMADRDSFRKVALNAEKKYRMKGTLETKRPFWNALWRASEQVNRKPVFIATKRYAMRKWNFTEEQAAAYAMMETQRTMTNFRRSGRWLKAVGRYLPFVNAGIQGQASFWTRASENPGATAARAVMYVAPMMIIERLLAAIGDAEDEYYALPLFQRDMYWNLRVGDRFIRIAKGHDVVAGIAMIDHFMEMQRGKPYANPEAQATGNPNAFSGVARQTMSVSTPLDISDALGPSALIVELMANYDFFTGEAIVPHYEKDLALDLRGQKGASPLGMALGMGKVDGRKVDHVIEGMFASLGRYATSGSRLTTGERSAYDMMWNVSGLSLPPMPFRSPTVVDMENMAAANGIQSPLRELRSAYYSTNDTQKREEIARRSLVVSARVLESWRDIQAKGYPADKRRAAMKAAIGRK